MEDIYKTESYDEQEKQEYRIQSHMIDIEQDFEIGEFQELFNQQIEFLIVEHHKIIYLENIHEYLISMVDWIINTTHFIPNDLFAFFFQKFRCIPTSFIWELFNGICSTDIITNQKVFYQIFKYNEIYGFISTDLCFNFFNYFNHIENYQISSEFIQVYVKFLTTDTLIDLISNMDIPYPRIGTIISAHLEYCNNFILLYCFLENINIATFLISHWFELYFNEKIDMLKIFINIPILLDGLKNEFLSLLLSIILHNLDNDDDKLFLYSFTVLKLIQNLELEYIPDSIIFKYEENLLLDEEKTVENEFDIEISSFLNEYQDIYDDFEKNHEEIELKIEDLLRRIDLFEYPDQDQDITDDWFYISL